ncbi:MAG TPA: glycoside hydrolase family 15 protein [Solirubrobacterales bacterium]|nr:glycoside hydrolase family 15 protein [Solirubrobacterales bacterium]
MSVAPHSLRDYALLADGERGVLVGPRGEFAWMCFPRWHDDAVFSALIGGESVYSICPRERFVWGGYYEPGTMIWRSRWVTESGIVECREALVAPAEGDRALVVRQATAVEGPAHLQVTLRAGAGFDRYGMSRLRCGEDGCWTAQLGDERLRWWGGERAEPEEAAGEPRALRLELDLEAGESHDFVLAIERGGERPSLPPPDLLWRKTEEWWREQVPDLGGTSSPRDARHAFAVMRGLTCAAGGMVAAATTSLPERAEQGRNYDYRYVWIRDQCYAGQAAARAGTLPLLDGALSFASERVLEHGAGLAPAYTVAGEPVPPERQIPLSGYPGGRDIVGNRVRDQFQLDAFGELLLLFAAAADHDRLDGDRWRAAEIAAEAIAGRHTEPEAGIWELEPERWTHSLLICSAGLRALAAHAPAGEQRARWLALADELLAEASRIGLHPSGRWQRAESDPRLDASLLLGAVRGAVPPDDPRSLQTLAAVEAELTEDGYCFRYQPHGLPLGDAEGAFLLCGFWMTLAHAQQDDCKKAIAWFERNRAACGSPGLLSEEFDVRQRQLRGNLPQAFVHALLLECAAVLGGG